MFLSVSWHAGPLSRSPTYVPDSVGGLAGTVLVTYEAVESRGTEPLLAVGALEARVAQTGPVDVVTLGAVLAVAPLAAPRAVRAHRTLVLASGHHVNNRKRFVLMLKKKTHSVSNILFCHSTSIFLVCKN